MSNIIPFTFGNQSLRVQTDAQGVTWFNANDVCAALELANPHKAVADHVEKDDLTKREAIDDLGRIQRSNYVNESGLYALIFGSTKESAKRFKKWVTAEVLPSIRKTGGYQASGAMLKHTTEAAKSFGTLFRTMRLIGLDKNAAAISANQATRKVAGVDLLALSGNTHLLAANQDSLYYTPTELGQQMGGLSGKKVNLLLAGAGLQARVGEHWQALDAGREFVRVFDTGKFHGSGAPIQQIKWSDAVIPMLKTEEVA